VEITAGLQVNENAGKVVSSAMIIKEGCDLHWGFCTNATRDNLQPATDKGTLTTSMQGAISISVTH
jgi:hypothetical protein